MNAWRGFLVAAVAAATSACGFALRPVVMNATPADWAALDGESMNPYWDPDRSCQAWASFVGSVDGTVVAGTLVSGRLVSVCEDGVRTLTGRWRVARHERPVR